MQPSLRSLGYGSSKGFLQGVERLRGKGSCGFRVSEAETRIWYLNLNPKCWILLGKMGLYYIGFRVEGLGFRDSPAQADNT